MSRANEFPMPPLQQSRGSQAKAPALAGAPLTIKWAELSDPGLVREANEDSVYSTSASSVSAVGGIRALFIVADGVAGSTQGEVASQVALDAVRLRLPVGTEVADAAGLEEVLTEAFAEANRVVRQTLSRVRNGSGQTTLTAAAVVGNDITIGHIGDTRAYIVRGGQVRQLTHDHTLAAKLIDAGQLTPELAARDPRRRQLTRAIGASDRLVADCHRLTLTNGDVLLLCSDGLSDYITAQEMLGAIHHFRDLNRCVSEMVGLAKRRGGRDNISVVLVEFGDLERQLGLARTFTRVGPAPRLSWRIAMSALVGAFLIGTAAGIGIVYFEDKTRKLKADEPNQAQAQRAAAPGRDEHGWDQELQALRKTNQKLDRDQDTVEQRLKDLSRQQLHAEQQLKARGTTPKRATADGADDPQLPTRSTRGHKRSEPERARVETGQAHADGPKIEQPVKQQPHEKEEL